MTVSPILSLVLACCGLFAAGLCLGGWMRHAPEPERELEDAADDAGLFRGWDGLLVVERKKRLALY